MEKIRVIIMGAGGRDFHNFNAYFRKNSKYQVVAFTAAQIEGTAGRIYPQKLSGKLYPEGIRIYPEEKLPKLIQRYRVDQVILAYSDLSHAEIMQKASLVLSNGADFRLMGFKNTMLKPKFPVVSICATRTGAGKSMVTRSVVEILKELGKRVAIVRHPMAYGDLEKRIAQRFESIDACIKYECTIEEREEFEQETERGNIVYAGVDYEKVLRMAEDEANIIVWDGGNNDFPFFIPSLHIVVVDALRPGDEISYYPGETNLRVADVVIVNKIKEAKKADVKNVIANVKSVNKKAVIIKTNSAIYLENKIRLNRKKVLVIEDGPTITHGGMSYGAAWLMAKKLKARIIDPRSSAVGSIKKIFKDYPHIGNVLPAIGHTPKQMRDLQRTINNAKCDYILVGTPIDFSKFMKIKKPIVRVQYKMKELGTKKLRDILIKLVSSNSNKPLNLQG
jgi:predicted GTPase